MGVLIRPSVQDDIEGLYLLASNSEVYWPRVAGLSRPTPANIVSKLEHDCVMVYVVESDDAMIGAASLYEHSKDSGTIWCDVVMDPSQPAHRPRAASLVVEAAFRNWDARKIYAVHPGFQTSPFDGLPVDWHTEGCFQDRVLWGGSYHDQVIGALYRRDWESSALAAG